MNAATPIHRVFAAAATALLALPVSTAAAGPRTQVVVIDKMKFGAVPPGLRVGDTLVWDNRDIFRHTATARDGSFSVVLAPHSRGAVRLTKAGEIAVTCTYHPGMRALLKVSGR